MLVNQILKGKSDDGVATIAPGSTVADAAEQLSARKIGALIVSSDGKKALGIISERDIVRALGQSGAPVLTKKVDELMTGKLVTCNRTETSDAILEKMSVGRFRHMPVLEGDEMIGLISIGDVVKARLAELAMEKDALEGMIKGF
ncbi:MAG: CBS domain-containing protein [Pseudomonadota bacterium]